MNKKISIVQCAREIRSGGGVSGVAYELEKEFVKLGVDVSRFTNKDVGISGLSGGSQSFLSRKLRLLRDVIIYSVFGTIKIFFKSRRARDEVFFCHGDVIIGDVYINHGLHRAMLFGSPSPIRMILRNPIHLFLLLREWVRFNLFLPRRVVCFCQKDASDLEKIYPKAKGRVSLIPNGVDVNKFSLNTLLRKKLRKDLDIFDHEFIILFVGHEFERKGLRFILEAMPHMPDNVRLLVAGGGGDHDVGKFGRLASELCVDDHVSFLGTRSDIPHLMNAADVFVLPAFYETWALVGLEAMACGTPALMYPVGGITEYLNDGENGFFIERDPEDIANKVRMLMDDPERLLKLGLDGRQTALRYSWDKVAKQYLALAREVAEEKERSA